MSVEQQMRPSPAEWVYGRDASSYQPPPMTWKQAQEQLMRILDTVEESQDDAQFSAELMQVWFQLSTWPDNQPFSMTVRGVEYWIRLVSEVSS